MHDKGSGGPYLSITSKTKSLSSHFFKFQTDTIWFLHQYKNKSVGGGSLIDKRGAGGCLEICSGIENRHWSIIWA